MSAQPSPLFGVRAWSPLGEIGESEAEPNPKLEEEAAAVESGRGLWERGER